MDQEIGEYNENWVQMGSRNLQEGPKKDPTWVNHDKNHELKRCTKTQQSGEVGTKSARGHHGPTVVTITGRGSLNFPCFVVLFGDISSNVRF